MFELQNTAMACGYCQKYNLLTGLWYLDALDLCVLQRKHWPCCDHHYTPQIDF